MLKVASLVTLPPLQHLRNLLHEWESARADELYVLERRRGVEQALSDLFDAPPEGQKTHKGPDYYRITRTNRIYYRGDVAKVMELSAELELPSLVKHELSETAIKKLKKEDQTSYAILVSEGAVRESPGTPHFEISRVIKE